MDKSTSDRRLIAALAQQHHLSEGAVETLFAAVQQGHGSSAQFSHPDLGGMGQWMQGGMVMVGDFSNHRLKAAVADICAAIAAHLRQQAAAQPRPPALGSLFEAAAPSAAWWPQALGTPSARGAQNEMQYAYFAAQRRLAVRVGQRVTLYDTQDHQISGVSQQQGPQQSLAFRSQKGEVALAALPRLGEYDL